MKLGLSTLLFPDGMPESGIRLASELNLSCVEIVLDVPHLTLEPKQGRLKQIRKCADSAGLEVQTHGRFLDLNPVSPHAEVRDLSIEQTIKSIEVSDSLNGGILTLHPGRCWFRGNKELFERSERWFEDYLKEVSSHARSKGVPLALETGSHPADYPGDTIELLRAVDGKNLGITLDLGHLYLSARRRGEGEEWILDQIELLKDKIVNVHIHDNSGFSDDHLPLQEGEIDFVPIVNKLKGYYDGPIVLELFGLSDPLGEVSRSANTVKKFWKDLRSQSH